MSSRSSGHAMYSWPSPTVYFPWGTPSNTSRSASEMHCRHHCVNTGTSPDEIFNYPAGEINFHRKDPDIFRTGELVIDDGSGSWDGHRENRRRKMWLMVGINGFPLALIYLSNSMGSLSAQRKHPRSRCSNILLRLLPIEL
jgi:hypothetical protein